MQLNFRSWNFGAVGRSMVLERRTRPQDPGPKPGPVRMQFQDPELIHFMQVSFGTVNFGAVGRSMVLEERTRTQDPGSQKRV